MAEDHAVKHADVFQVSGLDFIAVTSTVATILLIKGETSLCNGRTNGCTESTNAATSDHIGVSVGNASSISTDHFNSLLSNFEL